MAVVIPFKGFRYNMEKIGDLSLVTSPPYDIVSLADQERYYSRSEYNIIRIELGKSYSNDDESENRYTRARAYLNEWIEKGILVQEKLPALYIYDQEFSIIGCKAKRRRGLIGLVKLAEFSEKVVLPHENTLSKAKTDRFNLMAATNANISPIFSLYNGGNQLASLLENYTETTQPQIRYVTDEGIIETLWVVTEKNIISQICQFFLDKQLFIADGHHRYETALNYRNNLRVENPEHTGEELYNYVMMSLVDMDDPGLVIFPTHRVIRGMKSFNSEFFLKSVEEYFDVRKFEFKQEDVSAQITSSLRCRDGSKVFGYYDGLGPWYYTLTLRDDLAMKEALPDKSTAYRNLDVAVLHSLIFERYFGIGAENLANQTNVTYTRDIKEAIDWVRSKEYQCAFFLNPTRVEQVKEVSIANEKMPQKSTYFYPKLTTGLVIHKF